MERMASSFSAEAEQQAELRELQGMAPGSGAAPAPLDEQEGSVRLQIGAPDFLGGPMGAIEPLPEAKRVSITISHVSAFVPILFSSGPRPGPLATARRWAAAPFARLRRSVGSQAQLAQAKAAGRRQVLFDVSASVQPGELLALMGPSGSGKTSLLTVAGARAQKAMQVEGEVLFNGAPLSKRTRRSLGFVLQDDLLHEALTVHETLFYAAMLRLPRHMSQEAKLARVDDVAAALGLEGARDTIIGGFFRKGVSGGERKRCSIGVELLIDPSVLMLDEPTSGLDSTTSMHLLTMLRHLASGGRAIIATIHQPSSRLYQQLDKLLLLSQGHVLYWGGAAAAAAWFAGLGYPLPYGSSLADFLLDLASGDVATEARDGEASRRHLVEVAEARLAGHDGFTGSWQGWEAAPGKLARAALATIDSAAVLGGEGSSAGASEPGSPASAEGAVPAAGTVDGVAVGRKGAGALQEEHRWGAPFWAQLSLLFRRSLRTRRFQSMSIQDVILVAGVSLLSGLFWWQAGQDDTLVGARNTVGLLFFLQMFLSFRSLYGALFTFPDEYKHLLKERASGMYRLSAFYLARTLSDLPMDLALPACCVGVVYFMGGLRLSAAAFFGQLGVALLTMLVAQSIGLLLGSITMVPKTAQTIASLVMLVTVLTGGFFVLGLPSWVSWAKYGSYVYYALQIMLFIEFDGGSRALFACTDPAAADACAPTSPSDPAASPDCARVDNIQQALGLTQDPSSQGEAARNACILLAFLVSLRALVYWVLRRKTAGRWRS